MNQRTIVLTGLNGANPLGFMAALGCARLLTADNPETQLGWQNVGGWRPVIIGFASEDDLINALERAARNVRAGEDLSAPLEKNITVEPKVFREFARRAAMDPEWSPFAASFGCDALQDDKGRIQYTKLCFITGSGHQNFLETMRSLRERTTTDHLRRVLFEGMEPADRGLSMRWDPGDAKEYALQWANPGPEGVQSSWGAYRLAIEALPFFPAVPARKWLKTTGFASKDEFMWPIWHDPISADSIRSLIAYEFDLEDMPKLRDKLREMGIEELFRSQRVRIGEGANFKVSFRPSSPVSFSDLAEPPASEGVA
jgi:hypothetical protein